jgi:hypothetical protein
MKTTAIAIGFLLISLVACSPSPAPEAKPELKLEQERKLSPREATRAKYRKHSAAALQIAEPVTVQAFYFKDGGTIGLELTDSNGKKHSFCHEAFGPLYLGATHRSNKNAKPANSDEPMEVLYGVLVRWIDQHAHRDAFYDLANDLTNAKYRDLWELRAFYLRLEDRLVLATP